MRLGIQACCNAKQTKASTVKFIPNAYTVIYVNAKCIIVFKEVRAMREGQNKIRSRLLFEGGTHVFVSPLINRTINLETVTERYMRYLSFQIKKQLVYFCRPRIFIYFAFL